MSATIENPSLTAELERLAAQHVQTLRETAQVELNYSEATLQTIDEGLSRFHPDGNVPDASVIGYGAYVGETIRRNLGGIWIQDERGVALLNDVGSPGISASPFSWVQKRISNGIEDSLAHRYSNLRADIARATPAVPTPAKPVTQHAPPVGLRVAGAKPAATASAPSADDARTLARAPLLVFLLVAAADGKLDKKEFKKFAQVLEGFRNCPSPRLKKAIADMLPHMASIFEELTAESFDPMTELERVAQIMDGQYPSEARAFKEALLALAIEVGNASGGFLGFGNKIDENEAQAIAAVAVTLGLAGR